MNKILITGVAGMIGSHLLDRLMPGDVEIIGIDNFTYGKMENIRHHLHNSRFKFYTVSVNDLDTIKILTRDVDTIVHLAAVKKVGEAESSMDTLQVNVHGTENIYESARMWGCKVVFASTSDVYGMSNDLPFREDGDLLLGPSMIKRWSYAVSKLYCEQMAFAYYKDHSVPTVILRYFGGFSPRSSFSWSGGHIPIFVDAVLQNREVPIHGDGTQTRSMAYVDDIIDGTVRAMESEDAIGEIFNIGNDEELSVIETARLVHRIADTGNELNLKFIPFREVFGKYKDILRRVPDLTKSQRILGYEPKTNMEQAIRHVISERKKDIAPRSPSPRS